MESNKSLDLTDGLKFEYESDEEYLIETESVGPPLKRSRQHVSPEPESVDLSIELHTLLKDWNLLQYYSYFLSENISINALKLLKNEKLIENIAADMKKGDAILFYHHLQRWQSNFQEFNDHHCSCCKRQKMTNEKDGEIRLTDPTPAASFQYQNTDQVHLKDILNSTIVGKKLITLHEKKVKLNDFNRSLLVEEIVMHYTSNNLKLSISDCDKLCNEIVFYFPSEIKDFYFVRQKNKAPKGKLYQAFQNKSRKIRHGVASNDVVQGNSSNDMVQGNSKDVDIPKTEEQVIEENGEEIRSYLKMITPDTFEEVKKRWNDCYLYRKSSISKNNHNIAKVFESWPLFKCSYGFKLIDTDFRHLYTSSSSIFSAWEKFSNNIIPILQLKLKTENLKELLLNINNPETGQKDIIILYLLHCILPPTARFADQKEPKKKTKKFTVKDSQNSFFVHGTTISHCLDEIQTLKEPNTPIQPFILVLGTNIFKPRQIITYLDGVQFIFNNILEAIDTCFKIFFVFKLKYPEPSQHIWQFIQQYFYKIYTESDNIMPSISKLINDLM